MLDMDITDTMGPEDHPADVPDEDDDVFDHGSDMGLAAYHQAATAAGHLESPVACQVQDFPEFEPRVEQQPPAAKKARLAVAKAPLCQSPKKCVRSRGEASVTALPAAAVQGIVIERASLAGLEDRLSSLGEVPRFVADGLGCLRHQCSSARADVSFWPGSLQWKVNGIDAIAMEDALLGPGL